MTREIGLGATFALSLLLASDPARAIEIEPGQTYPAGATLGSAEAGLSLDIPPGWSAAWPVGSDLLVMARADRQAYVFLSADEWSEAEAVARMAAPIELGDGVVLVPESPPTRAGALWTADYRVTGTASPAKAVVWSRLGPHGIGVAMIGLDVVGAETGEGDGRRIARTLVEEIRFSKPAPRPTGSAPGEGDLAWQDYMRGRYIARYFTGSGYSEKTELWLCSDGRFRRSADAGGSGADGASGAFASRRAGRWRAHGRQPASGELVLEDEQGRASHSLALQAGKLFVDGVQWLRGENTLCP